ncbi:MAG: hypothetical protein VX498_14485 [Myxococcota bacterium]|nr:hypothetical protein [Myxococcota bacterium]
MSSRLLLSFAAFMVLPLLVGCAHLSGGDTGLSAQSPDWEPPLGLEAEARQELRDELRTQLAVLEDGPRGPAQRRRLLAALALLDRIDRIEASGGSPRQEVEAVVRAYARYLRSVVDAEVAVGNTAGDPPRAVFGDGPDLGFAIRLHDEGKIQQALDEGLVLLDSLQASGVDSLSLRLLLATWALEAEDIETAEELFGTVRRGASASSVLLDQAERGLNEARRLALGPDAAALAAALDRFEAGDYAGADSLAARLLDEGLDEAVLDGAARLRDEVERTATSLARDSLADVELILGAPEPVALDEAGALLARVEALPSRLVDADELRRLKAWHRGLQSGEVSAQEELARREEEEALEQARRLVAEGNWLAAIEAFEALEGTRLQGVARSESAAATDLLVKEGRQRAADLFGAASRSGDLVEKRALLQEARERLRRLASDFPDSSYTDRLLRNLKAVDRALAELEGD